jgi:hypothetical protein
VQVVSSAGRVLRVVAFLTVLGFLTVILIGPLLALVIAVFAVVAGVVIVTLPFALIGLLVWGVLAMSAQDRAAAWQGFRLRAAALGRWLVVVPFAACGRVFAWALGVGRMLAPVALPVARKAGDVAREGIQHGVAMAGRGANAAVEVAGKARSTAQRVGSVLLEVVAGAAIGAILICLVDSHVPGGVLAMHILGGTLAGACLGLLVGAARSSLRPERG